MGKISIEFDFRQLYAIMNAKSMRFLTGAMHEIHGPGPDTSVADHPIQSPLRFVHLLAQAK